MLEFDSQCVECTRKQRERDDAHLRHIKYLEVQNEQLSIQLTRKIALDPQVIVVNIDNYNSIKKLIENVVDD